MKDLAEYSNEGLALVRRHDFVIVLENSVFRDLTSNHAEGKGSLLSDLLPPDRLAELKNELASGQERCSWSYNFKPAKGRPIPVRFVVEVPKDGASEDLLVVRVTNESEANKRELLMKSVGNMLDVNRKRIEESKENFKAMLDRLPEGFFTFNSKGVIGQDCSARVEVIFGEVITGRPITEVLPITPSDSELIPLAFSGASPSLCLEALPTEFLVAGKTLEASFTPIIEDEKLAMVMVAIADVTDYRALREALDRNTRIAKTLYAILSAKREFLETLELVESLSDCVEDPLEIRRKVHTLKGEFSFLDCQDLAQLCHRWETEWHSEGYTSESAKAFIREMQGAVDAFLKEHEDILKIHSGQGVSDITVEGERLLELYHRIKSSPVHDIRKDEIIESIELLLSPQLEETLGWLERSWIDALSKISRPSSPIIWQSSVRIFPRPYRELFKTFMHVARNAAAHGIESPEERVAAGKSPEGHLSISASLEGGLYQISFTDDGRGINEYDILESARRKGIAVEPWVRDNRALQLIFEPEFSSQDEADEVAGRGLGLHIIQHEVRALGGTVEVRSKIGEGTTFTVTFPKLPIP